MLYLECHHQLPPFILCLFALLLPLLSFAAHSWNIDKAVAANRWKLYEALLDFSFLRIRFLFRFASVCGCCCCCGCGCVCNNEKSNNLTTGCCIVAEVVRWCECICYNSVAVARMRSAFCGCYCYCCYCCYLRSLFFCCCWCTFCVVVSAHSSAFAVLKVILNDSSGNLLLGKKCTHK